MNAIEELLKALAEFEPPPPAEHIYRIYYDPATGEITRQTYNEEPNSNESYLQLGLEAYKEVSSMINDMIVVNGRLQKRPLPQKRLPFKKSDHGYAAVKDNMIFLADGSAQHVEYWIKND